MAWFAGKNVLITGASSGIGEALAREFARKGANLVLLARRMDRLGALASELSSSGCKTLCLQCDVTREGALEEAFKKSGEKFGGLDVVVANAGFGVVGEVVELSIADYKRQFETNVWGLLSTVKASLEMMKRTRGRLVLVGSVSGYVGLGGNSPYTMSKFAVRALSECLYYELLPFGVSVTHIAPGFVESEIRKVDNKGAFHPDYHDRIPKSILMSVEKAARKIVWAVFRRKREKVITVHGNILVWLSRHMPWFLSCFIRRSGITARNQPS